VFSRFASDHARDKLRAILKDHAEDILRASITSLPTCQRYVLVKIGTSTIAAACVFIVLVICRVDLALLLALLLLLCTSFRTSVRSWR